MANNDASNYNLRYNEISGALEIGSGSNWFPVSLTTINDTVLGTLTVNGAIIEETTNSQAGSFQGIAGDTTLAAGAGRDKADGGSFQAAIMGNVHGSNLTKDGNYSAGVIGAYDIQGTNASELPTAGVLGMIFDGSTTADGIVVAEIDGSDPSSITRAGAAFKVRQLNANAGSGVDYGLDLYDTAVSGYLSVPTLPLAIANADIRMTNQVVLMNGTGAPTNGVTGDNFAGTGSIYIDNSTGQSYSQTGLITNPTWNAVGTASPAGADTQIQYNDSNSFGADSGLVYNKSTHNLDIAGVYGVTAGTMQFDTAADDANYAYVFTSTNAHTAVSFGSTPPRVTIGDNTSPDASAVLQAESTTGGFLPPRMTTTQRDAITSPAEGLVIYNLTTHVLNFFNGTVWGAV